MEVVEAVGRHRVVQELVDRRVAVGQMAAVGQKEAVGQKVGAVGPAVVVEVGNSLHIVEEQLLGDRDHSHQGAGEEGLPVHQ